MLGRTVWNYALPFLGDHLAAPSFLVGVDDLDKVGIRGAAHEEAVHVGEGGELLGVGGGDAAAVEDAEVLGDLGVDVVLQPLPQRGVHLLRVERFNSNVSATFVPRLA